MTSPGAPPPADTRPVRVLEPSKAFFVLDLAEFWLYRDLLYFLARRDVAVRYKQTFFGLSWALFQPAVQIGLFTVVFGKLAPIETGSVLPKPIFYCLGILPWNYFAGAVQRSGASLIANRNLLTKVYFPRLIIPLSGTISAAVDFLVAFIVLFALMLYYGIPPALSCVWLVPLILLTGVLATGVGLCLSAFTVRYRDIQHMVPFLLQAWMFASPVIYPAKNALTKKWLHWYALNPLTGLIDGYRAAVTGKPMDWNVLGISAGVSVMLFVLGLFLFKRAERTLADHL